MTDSVSAWICSVCGYVHRGDEPPDECPVCGALKPSFDPYSEKPEPTHQEKPTQWQCLVCRYIHDDVEAPHKCPLCGASIDNFEPFLGVHTSALVNKKVRVGIIGGGIAALSAAEALRQASPDSEIVMISKEKILPYYRLNLTRLLAGEISEEVLPIHPEAWYEQNRVEILAAEEVKSIKPDNCQVETVGGNNLTFDRLVLACGSHAFLPPIAGLPCKGIYTLRTLEDAQNILDSLKSGMRCVCVGGGILGLETAGALSRRGAIVTILEGAEYLMPRQMCQEAAEVFQEYVQTTGIRLITQAHTKAFLKDEKVTAVELESGERIPADLVVILAGVRSNSHLARTAGLLVNNGVQVDNFLRTDHPCILAAGDVAEHQGVLYGSWAAAKYQGSVAGMNAGGLSIEFGGMPRSHTLKVLNMSLTSIGKFQPEDGSFRVFQQRFETGYQRFVFRDGHLIGAILLGNSNLAGLTTKAIESKSDFSDLLGKNPGVEDIDEYLSR